MVAHILRVVEATANDLSMVLSTHFLDPDKETNWWVEFGEAHVSGAVEIIYGQPSQELMKPMRMALARVMDATLFWLLAQKAFRQQLESPRWKVWLPKVLADLVEFRQLRDATGLRPMTIVPDESLLDELLGNLAVKDTSNVIV